MLEDSNSVSSSVSATFSVNKTQPHIWHMRLGHPSNAKLNLLKSNDVQICDSSADFFL